jgi:hypothetical protein
MADDGIADDGAGVVEEVDDMTPPVPLRPSCGKTMADARRAIAVSDLSGYQTWSGFEMSARLARN